MNLSNISCEYFYDEEYDVAIGEGSYNQPFLNSFNNNCYSYFKDAVTPFNQTFSEFEVNSSDLWSESALKQSGNNNYSELCCDKNDMNVYKCISSDNVIDGSNYSLTKNLPFLNQPRENLYNYHLCYETRRDSDTNPIHDKQFYLNNYDFRKQFARRYNSKTFFDSGKCSAATSDSIIHPKRNYRPNSENNLNETSLENKRISSYSGTNRKSSKYLWRKLKLAFSNKSFKWNHLFIDNNRKRLCKSYSTPCLEFDNILTKENNKNNRYSTTIVELYNLLNDLVEESTENVFLEKEATKLDASCQFPESQSSKIVLKGDKKQVKDTNLIYPGLGKIKLPHQLRTSIYQLIDEKGIFHKLKFLEQISKNNEPNLKENIRRSRSVNRVRTGCKSQFSETNMESNFDENENIDTVIRCSSESRNKLSKSKCIKKPIDHSKPNKTPFVKTLFIIEENKSVSSTDLRPIPRNWGLSGDNAILAMFEFPRKSSSEQKPIGYDEENNYRLGGIVNNAIAAIKLVSDSVSNFQETATMCDKFIRCKDSKRQSTSFLLLAVDSILVLISDGLSADSIRNKRVPVNVTLNIKMTQRLWMFVEESCRGTLVKDASQKLALSNLLKQVKQTCGISNAVSRSKEWTIQLKLQIFIVLAIKNCLLHIWLKAVVANDTILHRFFTSDSFLRQARTSYSNALSAIVVEMRHLCMPGTSKIYNISKPVSSKSRTPNSGHPSNNSSVDNSLSKSKIPRSYKKPINGVIRS